MFNFSSFAGLLTFLVLALRLPAAAQAPVWQSARAVGVATAAVTSSYSTVRGTATDAAGNVYVAGDFEQSITLGTITLTSGSGSRGVFVAKFNPGSNQFVWAQRIESPISVVARALVINGTSVYVAGNFSGSASFGSTTLTDMGFGDLFVTKLTDAGTSASFVWARNAGGTGADNVRALAVNGTSLYVAGSFESPTASFDFTSLPLSGSSDAYVARLTDLGNFAVFSWALRIGGTGGEAVNALAVAGTSLYVTGGFNSPTFVFGGYNLPNTGSEDAFVGKLGDVGNGAIFSWAQRIGSTGYDIATSLAVSGTSVYVAGGFDSPALGVGNTTLTSAGSADAFVAKLTDAGFTAGFGWAQRAGGPGPDAVEALASSGTNVYVTGGFTGQASFGTTPLTGSAGNADIFMAKLTDAGASAAFVWAQGAGSADVDIARNLVVRGSNVYVAGDFRGPTAAFGAISLTNPHAPDRIGFLASLTDPTLTATTAAQPRESAQLFPNPARRTATLRRPAGTPAAPLTLTDATGRAVRRYPAPAGPETTLDLGELPAGLYLLRGTGAALRLAVE